MFAFSFSHGEMLYLLFIIEKLYFNTVGIIVNCHWRRLQSQVKRVHRHIKKEKKKHLFGPCQTNCNLVYDQ